MYILDTSALKGIARSKLESAKLVHDLAISPMTFYELICHLDEVDEDMTFERRKGNVMKCQIPRMLYDPFAHHAIAVGAVHIANESRFEDPFMIEQLLFWLGEARTLAEFHSAKVTFPDGEQRTCHDIAGKVRRVLESEEEMYVQNLHTIKGELLARFPECESKGVSRQELGRYVANSLKTMIDDYRIEDGLQTDFLPMKVTSSMWLHIGYNASRTVAYLQKAQEPGNSFKPDRNDCEDSYITMHLELFRRDVLVTDDTGTLSALNETMEAFCAFFRDTMKIETIQIEARVVSSAEFLVETLGIP